MAGRKHDRKTARSGKDTGAGGGANAISCPDEALWEAVKQSVTPLAPDKRRRSFSAPAKIPGRSEGHTCKTPLPAFEKEGAAPAQKAGPSPIVAGQDRKYALAAPMVQSLNARTRRRLSGQRTRLDATLDLHGMTQAEAYRALAAFIVNAARRNHRHVLIITGKGRGKGENMALFAHDRPGVLKRMVPQWLGGPLLIPFVSGMAPAGAAHGGEGALYVRIRIPRAQKME